MSDASTIEVPSQQSAEASSSATSKAGEVVWIPKAMSLSGDDKVSRRHLVLHDQAKEETVSVSYGSSVDTQARYGLPCVVVEPTNTNGLDATTYVFPGLLTPITDPDHQPVEGHVAADVLFALRALLPAAIGSKSGPAGALNPKAPRSSRRGEIVQFIKDLETRLSDYENGAIVSHGIVVSPHHVSCESSALQTVVPLLTGFDAENPDEVRLKAHAKTKPWLAKIPNSDKGAVALVPDTMHLKVRHYERTQAFVDDESLLHIERLLLARLGAVDSTP